MRNEPGLTCNADVDADERQGRPNGMVTVTTSRNRAVELMNYLDAQGAFSDISDQLATQLAEP